MGDNGQRSTSSAVIPQLARKCYSVDSSSNDDSDSSSSLLILPPVQNKNINHFESTIRKSSKLDSNNVVGSSKIPQKKPPRVATTTHSAAKLSQKTKPVSGSKLCLSSDSDTDSDEDGFLLKSKRAFEKAKHQRVFAKAKAKTKPADVEKQRKKREREALKEKEKQDKMKKRKEQKEQKERRKEKEKITKKQQNEEHMQAVGKYSHEEIAILLEPNLTKDDPHGLVEHMSKNFLVHPYRSKIAEGLSSFASMIQFVRKDKLLGGAKYAVDCLESDSARQKVNSGNVEGYEHVHYLVALFEPDEIIPLLLRDFQEEGDDYPALESWLDTIRSRWQRAWSSSAEPKIIFLLVGMPEALDKKWIEYRRSHNKSSRIRSSLPTVKELQDAMQWVLVQFQVESILCPNDEFLQSTVSKMARGLAEKPYIKQATELECIKKIKQGCVDSNNPLEKATDVWLRQLQQLPGLSETKAQHIVEHFPTIQSLWQAYQWEHHRPQEDSEDNDADTRCSSLLEDKFSADGKRYKKLSDSLYRVLTSNDPHEMIL